MPAAKNNYYIHLAKLLAWKDASTVDAICAKYRNTSPPDDVLLGITALDLQYYFNKFAYGKEKPEPDDRPIKRSSTLAYMKKAISFYMPRRSQQWDSERQQGNPTKSDELNDLIKRVKKFEVRRQGIPSQARRPFEHKEFLNVLDINMNDIAIGARAIEMAFLCNALWCWQYHLIARLDDMTQMKLSDIKSNLVHPFSLAVQMVWSKNIHEERDTAYQIVLGSMDTRLCPLVSMGAYFAVHLARHCRNAGGYLFAVSGGNNDTSAVSKEGVRLRLTHCINSSKFRNIKKDRKVGSHSIRKAAATYARRCNVMKDNVEARGRWKGDSKKKASSVYMDLLLPVPDASVAAVLCGDGGACKYVVIDEYNCDDFLQKVVPGLFEYVGAAIGRVLAAAVLWHATTTSSVPYRLPETIQNRVNGLCGSQRNVVERVPLIVGGDGDQLVFYESRGDFAQLAPQSSVDAATNQLQKIAELQFEVRSLKRRIEDLHNAQSLQHEASMQRIAVELTKLRRGVDRLGNMRQLPREGDAQVCNNLNTQHNHPDSHAVLSSLPRDLYQLWDEYQVGLNGNKAARLFTRAERGKCKDLFSFRNVFWSTIVKLVDRGEPYQVAIDRIYNLYGANKSVSTIIRAIRHDRGRALQ